MALKIANQNVSSVSHEREVEEHISTANPSHRGRSIIRTLLDSFEIQGPEGSHPCLVYPPMREPMSMYQQRFDDGKMPLPLIKTYIRALLTGLDYLHKNCRTVHTGKLTFSIVFHRGYLTKWRPRFKARKYHGLIRGGNCAC